jgi:hypothetical protein
MTKYNYLKLINKPKLAEEITRSSITTAFDHIDILTGGLSFNVWFKADLESSEVTILSALVEAHDSSGIQEVGIVSGMPIDPYTGKIITSDQRFNGPLYVPSCNFTTGYGSDHASWKPPQSNSSNNFWSIDVSTSGITKVTFAPNYNYQADGLGYRIHSEITTDAFVNKVILNPHIPSSYGGSYIFAEGKRLVSYGEFERYTDPKYIPKERTVPGIGTVPTNVLQFVIAHEAVEHISMEVFASVYPQ